VFGRLVLFETINYYWGGVVLKQLVEKKLYILSYNGDKNSYFRRILIIGLYTECDMRNWHTRTAILQGYSFPNPWVPSILDILYLSKNMWSVFQISVEPLFVVSDFGTLIISSDKVYMVE
jgi:hypothetical protein